MQWALFYGMMRLMLLIHILSASRMKWVMEMMKRLKILLLTRMMEDLPVKILGRGNQMLVKVEERKRQASLFPFYCTLYLKVSDDQFQKPVKREFKRKSSSKPQPKKKSRDGGDEASKNKKPKRKKDLNTPKKAMNGFMFFARVERGKNNLGIAPGEITRAVGDKWKSMTAEEKEPSKAMA